MATVRKLIVEVIDARNLLPKDGNGTSSPYVILDFHGQRRETRPVIRDLNPVWNETLEFNVGKTSQVFGDMLKLDVFHDQNIGPTKRNIFLGRVTLNSRQFVKKGEEVLIYYPLEKRSLFSWIQGEIGLKIYFADEVISPSPPSVEEVKPEGDKSKVPDAPEMAPDQPDVAKQGDENNPLPLAVPDEAAPPPPPPPPKIDSNAPVEKEVSNQVEPPPPLPPTPRSVHDGDQVMASVASGFQPETKSNNINAP